MATPGSASGGLTTLAICASLHRCAALNCSAADLPLLSWSGAASLRDPPASSIFTPQSPRQHSPLTSTTSPSRTRSLNTPSHYHLYRPHPPVPLSPFLAEVGLLYLRPRRGALATRQRHTAHRLCAAQRSAALAAQLIAVHLAQQARGGAQAMPPAQQARMLSTGYVVPAQRRPC
jgi:hypothetical protein